MLLGVGCGKISFGTLDGGGTPVEMDAEVMDAGPLDTGPIPDTGMPDTGPPPDDCLDPMAPNGWSDAPSSPSEWQWPFPRTFEAYNAVFWEAADNSNCTAGGCHGDPNNATFSEPLIPGAGLVNQRLEDAVNDLWPLVLSTRDGDWTAPLWAHHEDSGNQAALDAPYTFTADDIEFIQRLLDMSLGCYQSDWVANFSGEICPEDEPDAGVQMDAGGGGDAGDGDAAMGDGGDGDGAVDAGSPPDAGAEPTCYCGELMPDLSGVDTSYCAP